MKLELPRAAVAKGATGYPGRLLALAAPPDLVWVVGRLPRDDDRVVAIVGSRAASLAGRTAAHALAGDLAHRGFAVVSGGAFGVDAAAHEGALAGGGSTFAVLGSGVDVVYPDRHASLFARVAERGGLLSEHPPGTPPRRRHFPARNRLIVALAEAVIVAEARLRSGALITARLARQQGVRLLAVPGSAGTDALLRSGHAAPVTDAAQVEAAVAGHPTAAPVDPPAVTAHAALLQALRQKPDTPGGLAERLGVPLAEVMAALGEAEIDGWIRRKAGARYEVENAG